MLKNGWEFEDGGDIRFPDVSSEVCKAEKIEALTCTPKEGADEYYDDIKNCRHIGTALSELCEGAYKSASSNNFTLVVGGDHGIACGSIAGALLHRPNLIVVWVDAHADCNTPETSPSQHYHGMPVAHLMGWFSKQAPGFEWLKKVPKLKESHLVYIGLRHLDDGERKLLAKSSVHYYSMQQIDSLGIGQTMIKALKDIDPENNRPIHLSFDIDACDPLIAPGTGTKCRGGLTYREAHYICEHLYATGRLVSMDLVEINAALEKPVSEVFHGDEEGISPAAGITVALGMGLVCSAVGKVTI